MVVADTLKKNVNWDLLGWNVGFNDWKTYGPILLGDSWEWQHLSTVDFSTYLMALI